MRDSRVRHLPRGLHRLTLGSDALHAIIGGRSALDLPHLDVADEAAAGRFLRSYGYDLSDEAHRAEMERIRAEALGFLRGVLLSDVGLDVPRTYDRMPIIAMLLAASAHAARGDDEGRRAQAWACAILRVMHAFAHAENYFQSNYYTQIRRSILERFVERVQTMPDGSQVLLGATINVPLVRFEVKSLKPARSVVLKLLHKSENVATDLFDHIGVRVIVRRPVDALLAVRALHEAQAIISPNVKPTRSHNTLVDADAYVEYASQIAEQFQRGQLDEATAIRQLSAFDRRPESPGARPWNPHSSAKYRSIQFTCRQMIRFANPLHKRLLRARKIARRHLEGDALAESLATLSLVGVEPEIQFFFPYEVQVMDIASYDEATAGRASYAEYKKRQVETVCRRVLGRVMALHGVGIERPTTQTGPAMLPRMSDLSEMA